LLGARLRGSFQSHNEDWNCDLGYLDHDQEPINPARDLFYKVGPRDLGLVNEFFRTFGRSADAESRLYSDPRLRLAKVSVRKNDEADASRAKRRNETSGWGSFY